jgi:hypothetical protein
MSVPIKNNKKYHDYLVYFVHKSCFIYDLHKFLLIYFIYNFYVLVKSPHVDHFRV